MMRQRPGTIYLLHISPPLAGHAEHYLGWTAQDSAESQLEEHRQGRGADLTRAAVAAGSTNHLVVTRQG